MEHEFKIKKDDYEINIKVTVDNDEQKEFVDALGHVIVTNLSLLKTDLLNTCKNLTHSYSAEILENISDFSFVNNITLDDDAQNILDQHNRSNFF